MPNRIGSAACLVALALVAGCQGHAPQATAPAGNAIAEAAPDAAPGNAAMAEAPAGNASAAAPAVGSDDPGSQFEIAQLPGRWKVTGVAIGEGVTAYQKDDPAYMGQVLEVSAQRLAWATPTAPHATLGDRCDGPGNQHLTGKAAAHYNDEYKAQLATLGPLASDPHGIECSDAGSWGPEADGGTTMWRGKDGALLMSWYDGIVLKLARAG